MPKFFRWKRVAIALITAVIVVCGVVIAHKLWVTNESVGTGAPLPAVQQQQPGITNLQQVETALGPFTVLSTSDSNTPDTQFPAVLMVRQDGSVDASQNWTIPFVKSEWTEQPMPQITALTVTGNYVTFKVSTNTVFAYTAQVKQPFVLESVPQYVIYIDEHGNQWSISSTTAETLRRNL